MVIVRKSRTHVATLSVAGLAEVRAGAGTDFATVGGIIHVDTTTYSTPADTAEHIMATYGLPADTLNADGKMLKITAYGQSAANGNTKTIHIKIGTTSLITGNCNTSGADWVIEQVIVRRGVGSQIAYGEFGYISSNRDIVVASTSEDETTTLDISVFGQNAVANAADIVFEGWHIEVLN